MTTLNSSSMVLFSKQVDYSCNLRPYTCPYTCAVECKSNKARDLERYRSIRMAAGNVELELGLEC